MRKLIECVPNFSEGRDLKIIKEITNAIESTEGVRLLDVDPGKDTNRTVVTFVGEPEPVCEAAFRGMKKAQELIDMRKHHGEHPRFGATDVCPLVPVSGIGMEETIEYAQKLAERVGRELDYPVYCYEAAAFRPERKNLANVRAGEYEGLEKKLKETDWQPDFGPAEFRPKTGATAVGARDFLIAYNVNLNTTSVRRANAVAFDVREAGRVKTDPKTGKPMSDAEGNAIRIPGSLKAVKAIGWYIEEYGIAQISMNLTAINVTPVHIAFEEVRKRADERGMRVTGSELVGLMPLRVLTEAGKYFLKKQKRSVGVSEKELVKIAVKSLGLDDLRPFDPEKKVIEYLLRDTSAKQLTDMTLRDFADETASESPAPGGGSVSAYLGALGISLGTMVANLSSHKRGWDERWEEFSNWAEQGEKIKNELVRLTDEDTAAFNKIMQAFALPKSTEQELAERKKAIQEATKYAMEIPFRVMELALESMSVIKAMTEIGNPNSVTDAAVGMLCARTAVRGAYLNVRINAAGYEDKVFTEEILKKAEKMLEKAEEAEKEVLQVTFSKI